MITSILISFIGTVLLTGIYILLNRLYDKKKFDETQVKSKLVSFAVIVFIVIFVLIYLGQFKILPCIMKQRKVL